MPKLSDSGLSVRTRIVVVVAALIGGFILGLTTDRVFSRGSAASLTDDGGIGIPTLVEQVRQELIASDIRRTQSNMPALFTAKNVDLEISFVVKKSDSVGSKLALRVIDVDAKRSISSEKAQKMTLHLEIQQPEELNIPPSRAEIHK